ncbi:hypothetical protein IFM89_025325 [Coptis chinensis]|uniref:Uncharacterized protein n=1 Tax=Coptis chinensis TaxID=261450 RepID=A0A835I6H3_9MAGN|nr:hypothetical protein IFM89_025325 [Coptis chinensis]
MGKCRDGNTQTVNQKRLGGARAVLFVYAMQGLENMAYISNAGYTLLTVQAHSTLLRPFPCKDVAPGSQCEAADYGQVAVLLSGLYLVALGTGGVKAGLPSLGADQFDEKDPKETGLLSSFFNWLLFSLTIGATIGVIFVVRISSNQGWDWAFGVIVAAIRKRHLPIPELTDE